MAISRLLKPIVASSCGLALAACAYGGVPQQVARAQASTAAEKPGGLQAIATEMAASGDHEAAIPLFRHLAKTTHAPDAMTGLADSLLAMGNLEAAYQLLVTMVDDPAQELSGTTYYSYGKAALALGRFDEALEGFSLARRMLPNDSRPRSGLAIALAATGNTMMAISILNNATDPSGLSNKALVLAASGQPDAAISILEPMLTSGVAKARDRQNLAMAYLLAGREDRAYQIARLDLDAASVNETFTFYRSLTSLGEAERMQALVTGTIEPEWTRAETANLSLEENDDRMLAAQRFVSKPEQLASAAEPVQVTEAAIKEVTPDNYQPGDVPPLLEPEGWALQIGAYRSIDRLMRGWDILLERNIDILADIPPRRSEVDFGSREDGPSGFYYRLNAGPLKTLADARRLCDELKLRGTRCWIRPPETSEGKLPNAEVVEAAGVSVASR